MAVSPASTWAMLVTRKAGIPRRRPPESIECSPQQAVHAGDWRRLVGGAHGCLFRPSSGRGLMSFRAVFIALTIGFGLVISAFLLNRARPPVETAQPTAALIRASGKCAECHTQQQHSIVHEYELSVHARKDVNCLDCHQPAAQQEKSEHHGFTISKVVTAANCRSCHETQYQQFLRSRHAAPSWAAVYGEAGLVGGASRLFRTVSPRRVQAAGEPAGRATRDRPPSTLAARNAMASASRTPTARSALAPPVTRGTPRRSPLPACQPPADSATWGPTIRNWKSMTNPSTA